MLQFHLSTQDCHNISCQYKTVAVVVTRQSHYLLSTQDSCRPRDLPVFVLHFLLDVLQHVGGDVPLQVLRQLLCGILQVLLVVLSGTQHSMSVTASEVGVRHTHTHTHTHTHIHTHTHTQTLLMMDSDLLQKYKRDTDLTDDDLLYQQEALTHSQNRTPCIVTEQSHTQKSHQYHHHPPPPAPFKFLTEK